MLYGEGKRRIYVVHRLSLSCVALQAEPQEISGFCYIFSGTMKRRNALLQSGILCAVPRSNIFRFTGKSGRGILLGIILLSLY